MGFPDAAVTERAHTQLNHHSVEHDHGCDIVSIVDNLLDVGHEQQVSRLGKTIVESVVVDVADRGSLLCLFRSVFVNVGTELANECAVIRVLSDRSGVDQGGFSRASSWMGGSGIDIVTGGGVLGDTNGVEHADLTILLVEFCGLVDLSSDGIVTVVDVLEVELCHLRGFVDHALAFKVGLGLGQEVYQLGLVTETRDVFLGVVGDLLQALHVFFFESGKVHRQGSNNGDRLLFLVGHGFFLLEALAFEALVRGFRFSRVWVDELFVGCDGCHGTTEGGCCLHALGVATTGPEDHVGFVDGLDSELVSIVGDELGDAFEVGRARSPRGRVHVIVHGALERELGTDHVHQNGHLDAGTKLHGKTRETLELTEQHSGIRSTTSTGGGDFLDLLVEEGRRQSLDRNDGLGCADCLVVLGGNHGFLLEGELFLLHIIRWTNRGVLVLLLLDNDRLLEPLGTTLEFSEVDVIIVRRIRVRVGGVPINLAVVVAVVVTAIVTARIAVAGRTRGGTARRAGGGTRAGAVRIAVGTAGISGQVHFLVVVIIVRILAVMIHDHLVGFVVLLQGELHSVEGTTLARRERLEGCLVGETLRDVAVFQIHQQLDQGTGNSGLQDLFVLDHGLGQLVKLRLDDVVIALPHGGSNGIDGILEGFEGTILGAFYNAGLIVVRFGIGKVRPSVSGVGAGVSADVLVGGVERGVRIGCGIVRGGISGPETTHGVLVMCCFAAAAAAWSWWNRG
mmetsp:Transcript_34203/g.80565  ORF Transcript_34203/g.80565 Transcript_34203/m.80565 type:complete len:736 (-) Transcript_34203:65-2272(-)